nr:hemagglutinin repeat-containing protein [Fusobacterium animalis]
MSIPHSKSGVVTTIKGKDKDSSITYNNVKNIEYVGTQAKDTKFIYNNVDNITKKAVELNNYSSSSSKSSGVSAGVTINYNNGFQAEVDTINISVSKSNMNSNGTTYQNGLFVNVDEVHNNTKNMTLSGFNQVGGKVTGNIQNLTIESKQNTSTTTGSTKGGSIGFAPNGIPSLSANYSQTNGERKYVDTPTTFIIGDGSNLKVGKVENTASAIGTSGNGKLSIDEYVGHNLENKDNTTTKGASLSLSPNSNVISGVGINYANKDLESITKNTVIGNVEIGKTSGDEINKDLSTMTEVTKDKDTKTNVFVESQTIKYALNPEAFKEDIQKAKNEIHDIYHAVDSTVNPQGKESRNVLQQLAETRQAKTILNVVGSRLEIAENQDDIAKAFEGVSEDLGYKVKVIYTDPSNSPQLIGVDKNGNTYIKDGTAYVDKKTGIGYILINTESPANRTKAGVIGTIAEEQSHVIGKIEGRQKVVPDGSEKGLESLGKPTNDYFKNEFSKNDKAIGIVSDGKDYSNVDFGENVGDKKNDGYNEYKYDLRYTYQEKINGNIYSQSTKILSKTYTEKEIQDTIDKNYGKGYYKIDWNRYSKDDEYREQTNYYFYQAKYFVKAKTIDKVTKDYIEITTNNGEKLKLNKIKANEAIYHNIERKNGKWYFNFSEETRYKKYVDEDGHELILDQNNKPVYDPVVVGTYNFYTYDKKISEDTGMHILTDLILWRKYGTGPNDPTTREEREEIGGFIFGLKIQNNYEEIRNELKARGKDTVSYDELVEILEKIGENKRKK